MANSVPTLTNENWHMYEPSPLETSLAVRTGDVNAFPLMMSARGRSENAGLNYQAQVDQMHRAQIAEAMMAQQTQRNGMMATALKDASGTPGTTDVLRQLGILPSGVDTSPFDAGVAANSSAKNMGEAGRGLGAVMMAGGTGMVPGLQSVFGQSAGQGPSALEKAAAINANGRIASSGNNAGLVTVHSTLPDAATGRPGPFSPTVSQKVPAHMVPGLPFNGGSGAGLPVASGDGIAGNPLLGGIPGVDDTQLADKGVAARPAGSIPAQPTVTKTLQQVQQSVAAMMPHIAATNMGMHTDIAAGAINGVPNVIQAPTGGFAIKGASGRLYDANGF